MLPSHVARGKRLESKGFATAKPTREVAKAREDSMLEMRDREKSV